MSAEYAGKRQRGGGDGLAAPAIDPVKTSATSSADLESMMLKQALGRIDSLESQHEELKASVEREVRALREDICTLKEDNNAIMASTKIEIKALRDDVNALKSENKALKWTLNRLASKVQEGWEYPVAIQPDEYWHNKGYDDEAIRKLKDWFFTGMRKTVSQLEHGICDSIAVRFVNHDEDLMPHWKALFRSFNYINPYGEGVELCLHYMELDEVVMRQICNHIRHKNIGRVVFRSNRFTNMRGAISELGNALNSPKLKCLDWSDNPIESTEDMNLFMRVLSQSNSIDQLEFTVNGNDNAQALLSGVDFSLHKLLDFSGNNLQTDGRTTISDLIASNPPLVELDLRQNRLNDDDAVLIAQSLGGNTNLRRLYVEDNNIQERGMRALYEAVNDTSTLNALSDSNHSCHLRGLSDDFDLQAINSDRGSNGLCMNRMFKIHILMADRYRNGGGNVPHLNSEMGGEGQTPHRPRDPETSRRPTGGRISPEFRHLRRTFTSWDGPFERTRLGRRTLSRPAAPRVLRQPDPTRGRQRAAVATILSPRRRVPARVVDLVPNAGPSHSSGSCSEPSPLGGGRGSVDAASGRSRLIACPGGRAASALSSCVRAVLRLLSLGRAQHLPSFP
ncbi:hypothetical protein THAOC_20218 [Thalassiosira oceanica]|uniref:Uncharacterized protein n=1 Tax=Thalassiosira oceanica TaxID=159749 RepID=K0S3V8_THAOC|nr:hypothetical protein THAOC_20218 [Thalassiosira oceanica]|eukprot:EJK59539.1 hypothetical protein THAOC_20218 [Thalassiosira oceanica]